MKEMEEWKFSNFKICIILFFISLLLIAKQVYSKVSGHCSDCHTMHYSQGGTVLSSWGQSGPYKALLIGDCVFCHTGVNDGTNKTPYVYSTTAPTYNFGGYRNTLAGGNFYWVTLDDRKGHNVAGIANADVTLLTPPGFQANYGTKGRASWPSGTQVTCAGTYGCHGDPTKLDPVEAILGAHHNNITRTNGTAPATTVAESYRFLLGIEGTEDPDWEYTLNATDHNGYYATSYTLPFTTPTDEASINYLCGECHGRFHYETNGTSSYASPWIRHPTDFDMNNVSSKEYGNYPNIAIFNGTLGISAQGDYFADVPVGNTQGAVLSKVLQTSGDAIVLCVSCHRAHGSPYDSILRWNYKAWPAIPNNQNGCLACHTTKY